MLDARQSQRKPVPRIYCVFEELPYNNLLGLIVPRHSAILPRYNNQGIHANHVNMTKFSSPEDQGYRSIRDQLLIWAMEIKSGGEAGGVTDVDGAKQADRGSSHVYSGSVDARGGQVIQGSLTSSGDLNLNYRREGR